MKDESVNFTNFISFRLGALARDLARYFNNCFLEYNITIGQALVLYHLLDREDSSVKDIAEALELDSPAVSRLVDRLTKEGLIVRKEDSKDRRTLKINLTDKGRSLVGKILPISIGYNQLLKEKLGEERYNLFQECLSEIKSTLESK